MGFVNILSDSKNDSLPVPASTAFSIGDLCYWDSAAKQVKPLTSKDTDATEVLDQSEVALTFLGVSADARRSDEPDANALRLFYLDAVVDYPCPSQTFNLGDLVGATWNGGTALVNQFVTKVGNIDLAIGKVLQQYTAATTKVRCRVISRICGSSPAAAGMGGSQGTGVTALSDGPQTLTPASTAMLNMTPTAARTVTLPVEGESAGLVFWFTNLTAAVFAVTFVASDGTTAIKGNGVVPAAKSGIFWCDGTNWNGNISA